MSTLIDIITKPFKKSEGNENNGEKNENNETPEFFIDLLNNYQPTVEYSNELNRLSDILGKCNDSYMKKFIDLYGVIKLMHVLDLVQRSNPTQIDPKIKLSHSLLALYILRNIVESKIGREYIIKSYEMEPEESNLLRTFVSYLSLDNVAANEVLMDLINSLNESNNFSQHCFHQLKEPRPDTNNGFELICKLFDCENSANNKLINSICVLIKKISSSIPCESPLYDELMISLHDFGIIDKLEIIGNNNKSAGKAQDNLPLELYEDLSARYGKINIE